jgi:hypothetical protein
MSPKASWMPTKHDLLKGNAYLNAILLCANLAHVPSRAGAPVPFPDSSPRRSYYHGCPRIKLNITSDAQRQILWNVTLTINKQRLCREMSHPGNITYLFTQGGMQKVRARIALKLATEDSIDKFSLTVQPYMREDCRPDEQFTDLKALVLIDALYGWKIAEIDNSVGPLWILDCDLPRFISMSFSAPEGSDIQLLDLRLIGNGTIPGLMEEDDFKSNGTAAQDPNFNGTSALNLETSTANKHFDPSKQAILSLLVVLFHAFVLWTAQ